MKVVCISDTHRKHDKINMPEGDVLAITGDVTSRGSLGDLGSFCGWLGKQDFRIKIFVAGNHDFCFDTQNRLVAESMIKQHAIYLNNSFVNIRKDDLSIPTINVPISDDDYITFYGSPYQPIFHHWAFNVSQERLRHYWSLIPDETNFLLTHCPPKGILDLTFNQDYAGCEELSKRIGELKNLKVHAFGHIHECYGAYEEDNVSYINASFVDAWLQPVNNPIIVEI